jgi:hypothetical protein
MKNEGMRRSRDKKKKEKGESLVVKMAFSAAKSIGGKARVRNTIKEQRQQIRKLIALPVFSMRYTIHMHLFWD